MGVFESIDHRVLNLSSDIIAVYMEITSFSDVTFCGLVETDRCLGGTF